MRVRGDDALVVLRLGDHRAHLLFGVLHDADGVAFGENAAGRAGLDHRRAVLHLVSHRGAHLVRSIGDALPVVRVHETWPIAVVIAVTAGDAERMSRDLHART